MLSVGVGGAPTGQGARVLIIDDPVGDSEAAESALQRENLYRWYTDTIYPRLEPHAAIILMMQRWHEDDLAGRLLRDQARADEWHVLVLPALAETQEERDQTYTRIYGLPSGRPDPLGRAPGEALWPERFGAQALREIERVNPRSFTAKYQQRPQPAEGALFKRSWLRVVDAETVPQLRWARYYDLAYSLRELASNTATIAGAFDERTGTLYLRRGVAGRYETPDVRALIYRLITTEPDTQHGIEAKMHGVPVVQDLLRVREIAAIGVTAVNVHGDKYVRAVPVADRAAAGKVAFVRESPSDAWIAEWIEEMCAFPFGARDDRVDAVSGVAQMLANMPAVDAQPITGRRVWEFVGLG
jgi:predicted phage terminase large subunit-like protein